MEKRKRAEITTIKLNKKTKERLDKFKIHRRDSYEEILQRILYIVNLVRVEPSKAHEKLRSLEIQAKTRIL